MNIKQILLAAALPLFGLQPVAAQCRLNVMTMPIEQEADVPAAVSDQISTRFVQLLTSDEMGVSTDFSQFFITGQFSHAYKETLPGPPPQHVIRTTLTLWIGDVINKSIFSSCSVELRGVGTTEQRAYVNALKQLNARNTNVARMVQEGRQRILTYYESNYSKILQRAQSLAAQNNFDEALMLLTSIPECCSGYQKAQSLTLTVFQKRCDKEGQSLLTEAQGIWATDPTDTGASEAMALLNQIDPSASCYKQATALITKMGKTVKENWDFENKTKYNNEIDLQKRRIAAARAVGVAYGNNQKPTYITFKRSWW